MMKNILLALMISGFLVGCGGGSGSSIPSGDGQDGSAQQAPPEGDQNSHSQSLIDTLSIDDYSLFAFFPDQEEELKVLPLIIGNINNYQGGVILEIAKNEALTRSHCEKGSTGEQGLVWDSDSNSINYTSGSGSFNFSASSGVMFDNPIKL